jgi:hypothetical protein
MEKLHAHAQPVLGQVISSAGSSAAERRKQGVPALFTAFREQTRNRPMAYYSDNSNINTKHNVGNFGSENHKSPTTTQTRIEQDKRTRGQEKQDKDKDKRKQDTALW